MLTGTDADDTFMGFVGGETTMIGNGGQNTFVIIKGSGKDVITDFPSGLNTLDLRQVRVPSFDSFLQGLDNPSIIQKIDNPEGGFIYEVQSAPQDVSFHFGDRSVVLKEMYNLSPDSFVFYTPSSGGGSSSNDSTRSSQIGAIVGGALGGIAFISGVALALRHWGYSNQAPVHPKETDAKS